MSTIKLREAIVRAEILGGRAESEAWAELEAITRAALTMESLHANGDVVFAGEGADGWRAWGNTMEVLLGVARDVKR
jgi:hypothetical protein